MKHFYIAIIFLIFTSAKSSFAVSFMSYCLSGSKILFDTSKGPVSLDMTKTFRLEKIEVSEEIRQKLKDPRETIYQCRADNLLIYNGYDLKIFKILSDNKIKYIETTKDSNFVESKTLGIHAKDGTVLYQNPSYKVVISANVVEEPKKGRRGGKIIIHHHKNKIVKLDLKTNKILDAVIVFEEDSMETID